MRGLMQQLAMLAPHPDRPEHQGPLFVSIDPAYRPAAEYEGVLGSMLLDCGLGSAFAQAANTNMPSGFDVSRAADAASEFIRDRAPGNRFTLGRRGSMTRSFNATQARDARMEAFLKDLPRRLGIERWLADYQRRLYAMRRYAAYTCAA